MMARPCGGREPEVRENLPDHDGKTDLVGVGAIQRRKAHWHELIATAACPSTMQPQCSSRSLSEV